MTTRRMTSSPETSPGPATVTQLLSPICDVDKLEFLAEAGRHYRVFTFDLAAGVDTFLSISLAGIAYINDDRQPRDLSSEMVFQVTAGYDVEALVKLTNRDQCGPSKRYQITVEEIAPHPRPFQRRRQRMRSLLSPQMRLPLRRT